MICRHGRITIGAMRSRCFHRRPRSIQPVATFNAALACRVSPHMKAITSGALMALLGISCAAAASTLDPLAPSGAPSRPAPAPVKPVTETLWGKQVTDNYRYMEALDPSTIAWMKAQGAYTRSVLDAIKPLAALEAKIAAFTGSFGFTQGYANHRRPRLLRRAHAGFGQFRSRRRRQGGQAQDRRCRGVARVQWGQALCHQLFPRLARRQQGRGRNIARRLGGRVDLRL